MFLLFFLSLRDNKISDDGAHALSGALNVNQSLQKLESAIHDILLNSFHVEMNNELIIIFKCSYDKIKHLLASTVTYC